MEAFFERSLIVLQLPLLAKVLNFLGAKLTTYFFNCEPFRY